MKRIVDLTEDGGQALVRPGMPAVQNVDVDVDVDVDTPTNFDGVTHQEPCRSSLCACRAAIQEAF